jgi:hypothetical protein
MTLDLAIDYLFALVLIVSLLWLLTSFVRSLHKQPGRDGGPYLSFVIGPIGVQEVLSMNVLRLTNEERVLLAVAALTAHARPAAIDGAVVFESSDPGVIEILRVSDTSVYAVAKGLGTARIAAIADADLGSGTEDISGFLDFEVLPAKAVSLGIIAATPEAQPLEAPAAAPEPTPVPVEEVAPAGDAAAPVEF